jgi:hypothetical protein
MRKRLAADNGHKQSSEKAIQYEKSVREYKWSDFGSLLENDLVV